MHAPHPRRVGRAGALLPVALAIAAAMLLGGGSSGPPPGAAGDRYRAGDDATVRTTLPSDIAARVRARGLDHARALGVPEGPRIDVARVVDRFAGTVVDEIVTSDARGHRQAIVRLRSDGRLATAVRLGWQPGSGRAIGAQAAVARAGLLAAGAGLEIGGTPITARTVDGGWRISWPRIAAGVPVVGDGVAVTLFAEGTFHAAASRARELAAAPPIVLDRAAAERAASRCLDGLLGAARGQARLVRARLAWVAPNDTFDAAAPDAPDPIMRLAWIVEARTVAPLAERIRALELYVDATDGTLLGGDLLR